MEYYKAPPIPRAFIWRRAHSLTGLWLVLFLIQHLIVNSQAALFIGDNGSGFVAAANSLKALPYLPVIEIVLLGIPFLIHGAWGVKYLFTAHSNSFPTDGSTVSLTQYSRNHAYTWQRITSWILLFGILAHVIHMRFILHPAAGQQDTEQFYMMPVSLDNGLYTLAKRLGFDIYTKQQIEQIKEQITSRPLLERAQSDTPEALIAAQKSREEYAWLKALESQPLNENQIMTVSKTFGVAELLMVRDSFKNPISIFFYTGLVLASCFHAFNGLWTFMITWGVTLTAASQSLLLKIATGLTVLISLLGLAAIWGTYWLNLRY